MKNELSRDPMHDPTSFYDDLAPHYHLIFEDGEVARKCQAMVLAHLIKEVCETAETVLNCVGGSGPWFWIDRARYSITATDLCPRAVDQTRKTANSVSLNLNIGIEMVKLLVGLRLCRH
jgi:hypothetical protein